MTAGSIGTRGPALPVTIAGLFVGLVAAIGAGVLLALTGSILPFAVAAVAALALVLVLRPDLGTLLFLALLWLNVPGVLVESHGVPELLASTFIIVLIIPVAYHLLRREPIIITPALFAVLLFLAANLVSAAASTNPELATETIIELFAEGVLVYLLVVNAIRTPRAAVAAVSVLVATGAIMGALSLHQEATAAYRDTYLGFALTNRIEEPVSSATQDVGRPRMMGPIGEQNRFAQNLVVLVPLALLGLNIRHPVWGRLIPMGASLVILAGVFLTFSRGAAVALAGLLVLALLWRYIRPMQMLVVVLVTAVTVLAITPGFLARVESIGAVSGLISGEERSADGAILGRATSNLAALLVFADHPVAGVGPGVYPADYSVEYANELGLRFFGATRRAHNMYLEWAADLGVLGLTAGVAMIAVTVVQLQKLRTYWRPRRRDYANLAGALSLALVGYALTAIFLHLSFLRYFFTLLAVANSVVWMLSKARASDEQATEEAVVPTTQKASASPAVGA